MTTSWAAPLRSRRTGHVVVVDDEPVIREVATRCLEQDGVIDVG